MDIFLSYCQADRELAIQLHERLERAEGLTVTRDELDLRQFASPRRFMESIREHDRAVQLISVSFLKSQNCMRELLHFMKDDGEREHYLTRTVPIIVRPPDSGDELDIFTHEGQLSILEYWLGRRRALEDRIINLEATYSEASPALQETRADLVLLRDISEHLMRFLRNITQHILVATYDDLAAQDYEPLFRHLTAEQPDDAQRRRHRFAVRREISSVERLRALDEAIIVASDNDPRAPEFPPFSPRFPATPVVRIKIPELNRRITIKDESRNHTGSHKDRMAWEVVVYYKTLIRDLLSISSRTHELPPASIISNGSAALAIQTMLRTYHLPDLHVLMDTLTERRVVAALRGIGCRVYLCDLSQKELDSDEVLQLTENEGGFDLTDRQLVDPNKRTYYDWLSYEILNIQARHIFLPVGTGDLFVNVLSVLRDEVQLVANDRRLRAKYEQIQGLNVYGATSYDPKTKLDKLYARWRPTLADAESVAAGLRESGVCGQATGIYEVEPEFVARAMELAHQNDIQCEESGIAGLGLFLQLSDNIPTEELAVAVNTGWMYVPRSTL